MPRTHLAHRVMDTIQELKRRASTLEAKGDDSGALKIYTSIPPDQIEAGVLGRMANVQARLGKLREAAQSHRRSAAKLKQAGFRNAAIHAYRQAVELDPENADAFLHLGQLAGEAGYRRDAAQAFGRYLAAAGIDPRLNAFFEALATIPAGHRAEVVAPLRDELLARDPSHAARVEELLDGVRADASSPTRVTDAGGDPVDEPGLTRTGLRGGGPPPEIAPLPGLETNAPDADDLPPLLGDLPLLESALDREHVDPLGGEDARDAEPVRTIPDLETFQTDAARLAAESPAEEEADEETEEETEEGEPGQGLPLLGPETESAGGSAGVDPVAAATEPEAVDDWIDLGAMVLGDHEEGREGEPAGSSMPDDGSAIDDVTELLRELGAQPVDDSDDVGSRYDLGLAYKEMGLLDAAIAQLHGALAEGDHPLASLEVLGECYLERGEHERACRVLERAIQIGAATEQDLLGVRYLLGRCGEAMGEIETARDAYTRVIGVEPRFRDAAARLSAL